MASSAPSPRATSSSRTSGRTNGSVISAAPSVLGGLNNATLSNVGGGYVAVEYVFIQFAGYKSSSAYATPWNGYPGNNTSFLIGGEDSVTGVNNIQYTAQFGNGVSASVGLDDPTVFNRTPLFNLGLGVGAPFAAGVGSITGLVGSNAYGGFVMPDLVGNVRVDQAWGLFQASGELHMVNASYNALGAGGIP
jgi:Porin subfamily